MRPNVKVPSYPHHRSTSLSTTYIVLRLMVTLGLQDSCGEQWAISHVLCAVGRERSQVRRGKEGCSWREVKDR